MKGRFNKLKLLCCFIISIFILGFGGEVKAEVFYSKGTLNYRSLTYFQWFYPSYNSNVDAYCINSAFNAPSGLTMSQMPGLISNAKRNSIINILKTSQNLNLSAGERYYVTQAAIWYTLYGTGYNGITPAFYNWISTNYSNSWNTLMNSRTNAVVQPTISIKGSDYTLRLDGDYLVSKDYSISANGISGSFNVKIDNGTEGACILYNGSCTTSTTIPANTNFKIRVNKTDSGEVNAKFTVTPINTPSVSDIVTYGGLSSQGYQNIVVLTNIPKTVSKSQSLRGRFDVEKEIQVQKVDADTGKKVAGAEFYILDSNGSKVTSVISTAEGEENPKVTLPNGDYTMIENAQPDGYYSSDDAVQFSVTSEGVKDKDGNLMTDTVPTISYSNSRIKIKFRKLDASGNPMAGIKFIIAAQSGAEVIDGVGQTLCAISDSNGYLTQECTGSDKTNNVRSDGEYTLGIDFGEINSLYKIKEVCETDACKKYTRESGEVASFTGSNGFYASGSGKNIVLDNNNLSLSYEGNNSTPTIVMNMTNKYYLNISKGDITSGKEIPGATLTVADINCIDSDGNVSESCAADQNNYLVDSWKSTTTSHEIQGIVPGNKYRLIEDVAPEGYIRMVNAIDFIMDEDGNVTTYDITTGEAITDLVGSGYGILITNAPTKTLFSKTSAVTGEEIAGAKLKVCTSDSFEEAKSNTGNGNNCEPFVLPYTGETVAWESEAGKTHIVDALPAGDYYLVETIAPSGYYTKTTAVDFTVKTDGSVSKVEMTNEPTKVKISKVNQITGERIAGASMQILNASDRSIAKDFNGNELTWVSKADSDWEILGLPVGDYILIETVVPEGFQEGMIIDGENVNEYNFSVIDNDDELYLGVYVQVMNAPNTGMSTLNLFAIGGLLVFVGYETIKIYRRKALN